MCKLCKKSDLPDWDGIKDKLKDFIHILVGKYKIQDIIIYGSYARGDYHENSDIDLIIIGDFKQNFFKRIGAILDLTPIDLHIEPLVYTNSEFNNMKENENPFILTIISEGIKLI